MVKKELFIDKDKVVDKLANTVAQSLAGVGGTSGDTGLYTWPSPVFMPAEGEIYLAPYFLPTLYSDIITLEMKGYKIDKIAKLLKAPSRIAQTTWPIFAIGLTDLTMEQRVDLAYKIVLLISEFRKDPFCENLRNIIWSNEKVKEIIDETNWVNLNKMDKPNTYRERIGRLSGLAWLFCEMLYTSIHGAGHEFHGPYKLEDGLILLVKEYYNLKPIFWTFTNELSFDKITIFGIYNDVDVVFDFFNRTRSTQPLSPYLQRFFITVDDKKECVSLEDIHEINDELERVSNIGLTRISKMSRKELMKKFFESYYFIIKPLRDELKQDWSPPNILFDDLEKEKRKEVWEETLSGFKELESVTKEEFVQIISKIFNPRFEH